MGREDWYRRTIWDEENQKAFFDRLHRSRSDFHKAQYARIQASFIEDQYPRESLQLLYSICDEFPHRQHMASVYLQVARCLVRLKRKKEAIPWFRKVLDHEKTESGCQTMGYLDFPIHIVTTKQKQYFDEIEVILRENRDRLLFPIDYYNWNMCLAILEWRKKNRAAAGGHARAALHAAEVKKSGFRYHPKIGLVKKLNPRILRKLVRISKHH